MRAQTTGKLRFVLPGDAAVQAETTGMPRCYARIHRHNFLMNARVYQFFRCHRRGLQLEAMREIYADCSRNRNGPTLIEGWQHSVFEQGFDGLVQHSGHGAFQQGYERRAQRQELAEKHVVVVVVAQARSAEAPLVASEMPEEATLLRPSGQPPSTLTQWLVLLQGKGDWTLRLPDRQFASCCVVLVTPE